MFCSNCGNQIPDGSKFCRICGAAQELPQNAVQSAPQNAAAAAPPVQPAQQAAPRPQPQPAPAQQTPYAAPQTAAAAGRVPDSPPPAPKTKKTPLWVRLLFIAVAVLIGRGLGQLFAASYNSSGTSGSSSPSGHFDSSSTGYTSSSSSGYASNSNTGSANGGGTAYSSDSGDLGSCYVYIRAADTYVNAAGDMLLIITLDLTNTSTATGDFDLRLDIDVSQDGQALSPGILSPTADEEAYQLVFGSSWEVAPGASVELRKIYALKNTTSDVLVEVSPFSWYGDEQPMLKKIFMFSGDPD